MKKLFFLLTGIMVIFVFAVSSFAIHEEVPAETQKSETPPFVIPSKSMQQSGDFYKLQALISLLEKKGIINNRELNDEIKKIQSEGSRMQ